VMTTDEATTEDQLKAFSSEWFDEAYKTSKGIF
jgi:hypothetical protein